MKGFREFLLRGNVVDLDVAVVIGAAFSAVVTGLVADFITPLIAAVGGQADFSNLSFTVHGSTFKHGDFINRVISFLIIAAAIYFIVVLPMNRLADLRARGAAPEPPGTRACPECLSDIPVAAQRCAFCSAAVTPLA